MPPARSRRCAEAWRRRRSARPPSRCSPRRSCAARRTAPIQSLLAWIADESRAGMAAIGAAARRGGRAARRGDAGHADGADAGRTAGRCGAAVSDLSGRTRRSRRRVRVPAGRRRSRGGRRRPRWRRIVRLNREPAALSALAASGGDLGTAGHGVLARVEWPGKPGAAAPIAPLTRRRAAALRRRPGGLQEHLPGLPSAGRTRPGEARAQPRRLGAGARAARGPGAHPAATARRARSA